MNHFSPARLLTLACLFLVAQAASASVFHIDEFTIMENGRTYWHDSFSDGVVPRDVSVESPAPVDVNLYQRSYLTRPLTELVGTEAGGKLTLDTADGHVNTGTANPIINKIQRGRVNASTNATLPSALTVNDAIEVSALYDLDVPDLNSLYSIRLVDWVSGTAHEGLELAVMNTADDGWVVKLRQAEIGVQWHTLQMWDLGAIPNILEYEQILLKLYNDPQTDGTAFAATFQLFDTEFVPDNQLTTLSYDSSATGRMFQVSDWLRPGFTVREWYAAVPEPSILVLFAAGLVGMLLRPGRRTS